MVDDPGDVVEPVVTVHRFPGRFLHATADRVIFLGAEPDGTPVVVSRSLDRPRPPLLDDDAFRTPVPAGDAKWCVDHVVVAGVREAGAVNPDGKVEWRFALPGKPDARESLVGVLGVDGSKVLIASQFTPAAGDKDGKPFGRVFWFDRADGRLVDCITYPGGFGTTRPLTDIPGKKLYTFRAGMECYDLATGQPKWSHPAPAGTVDHPAVHPNGVVLSGAHLASVTVTGRAEVFPDVKLTAPAGVRGHTAYAGLRGSNGANMVVARQLGLGQQLWVRDLPAEVAATPVATARAVYVVAGRVLYRLDPKTAATCWKKTLPLGEGEVVDELTRAGDELWVSGVGFFARVRNETPLAKDDLGPPPAEFTPPPPVPSSFPPAGAFGGR